MLSVCLRRAQDILWKDIRKWMNLSIRLDASQLKSLDSLSSMWDNIREISRSRLVKTTACARVQNKCQSSNSTKIILKIHILRDD